MVNKTIATVFEVYVCVFSFLFASKPVNDADIWFHFNTAEYILQKGMIPRTEFSSFTNFGAPFVAHGWLSALLFYLLYKSLGLHALTFITAFVSAISFWIVFRRAKSRSHPFIAGFATLLAVWTALPYFGVRPRVFTLLFSSIFLALLDKFARSGKGKAIWWLVPIMVLWVNLHGGFLLGFALIGFAIAGVVLDGWMAGDPLRNWWPRVRTLTLVLLACLAVGLINPYGLRMYTFPFRVLSSPVFQEVVVDWVSPNFHNPQFRPLLILILLSIVLLALSPKRVRPSELLLFIATLYSTLKTNRQLVIFSLVAAPLLAEHLQHLVAATSFGKPFTRDLSPHVTWKTRLVGLLLVLPLALFALRLRSTAYAPLSQDWLGVPVGAVEFMKEKQIEGNTFTDPNVWGSYVSWSLHSNPIYIDGRDVFPEAFVKEYTGIIRGTIDWHEPFARYGVQIVLIRPDSIIARQLPEAGWQKVYEDKMAVVFKKSG